MNSRKRAPLSAVSIGLFAASLTLGAATVAHGQDAITITYAYWDTSVGEAFKVAADEFHRQHPNITVEPRLVPFGDYFTKLNTQISSNTAPDAFWVQNIQFPLYQQNGALADLTPFKDASKVDLSGIDAALINPYIVDGKLFAIPFQALPFGLYYNKALFDAKGIAVPTNDWTWADVEAAAAALTDPAAGVFGITAEVWNYGTYYQTMYNHGAKIITEGGKNTDFDSPEAVAGLSVWTNFMQKGYSPTVAQLTDTWIDQWFTSEKVAMVTTGSWIAQTYKDALGDKVHVVEMPMGTVDTSAYATTTTVVSAGSPNIEAAYLWAEFLGSEDGQNLLNTASKGGAGAPVNAKVAQAWVDTVPGIGLENLTGELSRATLLPATKNTLAWESELAPTLTPAYNGAETTEAVAKKMAEIIRAKLAEE